MSRAARTLLHRDSAARRDAAAYFRSIIAFCRRPPPPAASRPPRGADSGRRGGRAVSGARPARERASRLSRRRPRRSRSAGTARALSLTRHCVTVRVSRLPTPGSSHRARGDTRGSRHARRVSRAATKTHAKLYSIAHTRRKYKYGAPALPDRRGARYKSAKGGVSRGRTRSARRSV